MVPMNKLLTGIEAKREAIVTNRPPSFEADLTDESEQPIAARLRKAAEDDVVHRIWTKDGTLWAPAGTPELADRLGWLTIAEQAAGRPRRDPRVRARACARTASPTSCCSGWAAPASPRRSSAARARRPRARCASTCWTRPSRCRSAAVEGAIDVARDALRRLLQVRRDDRAQLALRPLPRAPARRPALRGDHRPGHEPGASWPSATASGASSSAIRRSAGATPRCRRSGSCPPRWRASTSTRCSTAARSRRRTATSPRATPASGWASRSASSRARAATS